MDLAFSYVRDNGIMREDDYPYIGRVAQCSSSSSYFKNSGFVDVARNSDQALQTALTNQPVSIAIAANKIRFYTSGIFNDWSCGVGLNHGVLAVGYDNSGATPYYIVKNSWGAGWGDYGYIKFARDATNHPEGMCGCDLNASYPSA
eukprot:TRINITY_DN12497_c0_g1_i1.p1 TRINITY_DN12497_c0_g1~~TRINITY_DN12497_c0_g1_i1.p1  ORF type:complete len:146 (+),score=11.34 TRINITY_DN12497_c0_g1_i1:110-547(+)